MPSATSAQSFAIDFHYGIAWWGQMRLNRSTQEREAFFDYGIGTRISRQISRSASVQADLTIYPEFANNSPGSGTGTRRFRSAGRLGDFRIEGLFGVTAGRQVRMARPFVKAAVGFVDVYPNEQFECGPDYLCLISRGATVPAFELGGGIELAATPRFFYRFDVSERVLKYPETGSDLDSRAGAFVRALRITGGGGWRF